MSEILIAAMVITLLLITAGLGAVVIYALYKMVRDGI